MIKKFFHKWLAFFRPVPGWEERIRLFKGGSTTWDVPGRPDCSKLVPFPLQWIPHRLATQADPPEDWTRGFLFEECECTDTGKKCAVGRGVLCLRCGVPLSEGAAHMIGGFDPPYCKRCRWPIKLAL